jgi:hypothetical protein
VLKNGFLVALWLKESLQNHGPLVGHSPCQLSAYHFHPPLKDSAESAALDNPHLNTTNCQLLKTRNNNDLEDNIKGFSS